MHLGDVSSEGREPWGTHGVVERHAGTHRRNVFRRMEFVGLDIITAERVSQNARGRGFANPAHAHHDESVLLQSHPLLPLALSFSAARVDVPAMLHGPLQI